MEYISTNITLVHEYMSKEYVYICMYIYISDLIFKKEVSYFFKLYCMYIYYIYQHETLTLSLSP